MPTLNEQFKFNPETLPQIVTAEVHHLDAIARSAGKEVRLVGGCVRDIAMGAVPEDIDLCMDAAPDTMMTIFGAAGLTCVPTGLAHGTITVVGQTGRYEITSLRQDLETDGRHATVGFIADFQADAARRDFTINAMSLSPCGRLYDYFGGMPDLMTSRVRFVGHPEDRIQEDYLRALRYYRFVGRLIGAAFDPDIEIAIQRHLEGISGLSPERIWAEVKKTLKTPRAATMFRKMTLTGVAAAIGLPDGDRKLLATRREATADPVALMAVYLDSQEEIEALAERWRWAKQELQMAHLIHQYRKRPPSLKEAQDAVLDGGNRAHWSEVFRMHGLNLKAEVLWSWEVPTCPINGRDLLERGYPKGEPLGIELKRLRDLWKAGDYRQDRDTLLNLIQPLGDAS